MSKGKLRQKNVRLYDMHQKMIDELLKMFNEDMAEKGYEAFNEAEFIRFMIGQYYSLVMDRKGLPNEWKL